MIKILSVTFMFLITIFISKSGYSQNVKYINDIPYFMENMNYPVWTVGNRAGAAADLESAYIANEDEKWRQIAFGSYTLIISRNEKETNFSLQDEILRECYFWQKISTGEIFFNRNGIAGQKVEGKTFSLEKKVFTLLLNEAMKNMGRIEKNG